MKLTFNKMGINGEGIGYDNRMPVFCSGVLPGETADVNITEKQQRYARAELAKLLKTSPDRVESVCPQQNICGACPLLIMDYPAQLRSKKGLLEEALYKYAGVRRELVRNIHASPDHTGYRSQCKLPLAMSGGLLKAGMYTAKSNHFKPVEDCPVHTPGLEKAKKSVLEVLNAHGMQAYTQKTRQGVRYLIMRELDGQIQCTLVTGKETIPEDIVKELMEIEGMHSLFQSFNTERGGVNLFGSKPKKLAGANTTAVKVNDITLRLSPQSFFQLNIPQASALYKTAVDKIDPCDVLVEAYCGVGAMSLMAHAKAKEIYGIENSSEAISNAEENAKINRIENVKFMRDDAAEGFLKVAMRRDIDCLLIDPPRSGMDDNMLEAVMKALPRKIIYISCNPATLAKNLKVLKQEYKVVTVIPYDLFPNTAQVESVTVLERISK